ncbi:hypothetical protein GT755_34765 [Herbidospora sp. NEAU-GS84]|uniref:O-acyltransferase WSD1-like N-terminal domain-containing protein n=1 Tax=Herbidospora solisilvae TaxID=2696284 RepID=A0A7C9J8K9_9ACTN|nr:wax ester/triacylglycerol synthase domain-containing protein [Herbidospora solisilvae]NAS26820.1 hypothetical protein [Herbidospora solisilvae]
MIAQIPERACWPVSSEEWAGPATPARSCPTCPGPISPRRRFALGRLPLGDVKKVKIEHGTTIKDVVMALAATALCRWLSQRDELPVEPLGNQVLLATTTLPINVSDAKTRLRMISVGMAAVRNVSPSPRRNGCSTSPRRCRRR